MPRVFWFFPVSTLVGTSPLGIEGVLDPHLRHVNQRIKEELGIFRYLLAAKEEAKATAMSTMRFCRECNNILYPKEEKQQKILLYACRNCDHQEVADNYCVYRNVVDHSVSEFTQVLEDVTADPTLPRTKSVTCAQCGHHEAVFFQAGSRGDEGMTLFFVCCNPNCGHRWRD